MQKQLPRAILIDIVPPTFSKEECAHRLREAEGLVSTYGGVIVVHTVQRRSAPDPRTYVGRGKVEELADVVRAHKADILIINGNVKPRQIFEVSETLRKLVNPQMGHGVTKTVQVWDRVDLILKIFALHAKTAEAKLQITLASIGHMGPRIYKMGMDLSQQGGGIGTRGAGETNTEKMKRHLAELKRTIEKKLEHQSQVHETNRKSRLRAEMKSVSIVGYTNAGKSSLLNALTHKGTYVADALFATLSTSTAKLFVDGASTDIVLSDTIGFIQDLPPQLISAFRSTLEETVRADVLLHVVDASDIRVREKIAVVHQILEGLGANAIPKILVLNKVDMVGEKKVIKELEKLLTGGEIPLVDYPMVTVSARIGEGLEELKKVIVETARKIK